MARDSWKSWAAVGLSAGLLELPFPLAGPMPPWRSVFAWIGLVPLLWAILSCAVRAPFTGRARPLRTSFLLAYVCGVLWYAGNCYWIYDTMLIHGGLPPIVSALILLLFSLVLGLYFGLFGFGIALVCRATGSVRLALGFAPFLWTALELANARITSVPWDQLGYSQIDNRFLATLAPWTGVYGISFVLVAANAFLVNGLLIVGGSKCRPAGKISWAASGLSLLVIGFSGVFVASPGAKPTVTAVLIQPNLDVENTGYWLGPGEWDRHIGDFVRLGSEDCKTYIAGIPQTGASRVEMICPPYPSHPDLIVWPESPAPFFEIDARFKNAMKEVARSDQAPVIVNGVGSEPSSEGGWIDHVSAMVFGRDGNEIGRYDKIHLVPWGEYVPYPKFFFFARKLTGKVAQYTPGTVRNVFRLQTAGGETHRYGVFICYESVFADEVRQFARFGAEVLVNLSDDGWYGDTSAPWQHLNMVRMRAVENRRWILRDTNNGVTAAIDPYGRVTQSIPRHCVDALPAEFAFRDDITFYTEHGDVFAWVCAILGLVLVGWCFRASFEPESQAKVRS